MRLIRHFISISIFLSTLPVVLSAQEDLLKKADAYQKEYRFAEAAELNRQILESLTDTTVRPLIEQRILVCENGGNFMHYASRPVVSAKKNVPSAEFYLWFPALRGGWASIPNSLVTNKGNKYMTAVFFPEDLQRIVYSVPDDDGQWDIYEVRRISDTLWSEPLPAGKEINTHGNEIFPVISADGHKLWFASDGLPGLGGYDLFVSEWNEAEKRWGAPENLGFPYSSTSDDILYMDSPDSKWSVLASTRDASDNYVNVYALEFAGNPIKTGMSDISEIQKTARLDVTVQNVPKKKESTAEKGASPQTDEYTAAVSDMKRLKNIYQEILEEMKENRLIYENSSDASQQDTAAQQIQNLETAASQTRKELDAATGRVREAEMDFLKKGIMPPVLDDEEQHEEKEEESIRPSYTFTRQSAINAPQITTLIPEPEFDFGFSVQTKSTFARHQVIPEDGICYQVQMVVLSTPAGPEKFKGLSPIFENKLSGGKFQYCAGLFRTYSEASAALPKVKGKGFTSAFIVAYDKGKTTSVKNARLKEGKAEKNASYNVLISGYAETLPAAAKTVISSSCTKDIAKSTSEGRVVFIIGPFTSRSEAESLITALEAVGTEGVSIESIAQ